MPALWGEGLEKGQWPLITLMPDTLISPYKPLVPFKLLPWYYSSEGVRLSKSVCGFFKRNCLRLQQFLPPIQFLLVFIASNCGDLPSSHWNPVLGGLSVVMGLLATVIYLPNFYPPHMNEGPACSPPVPLLPVWIDMVSLIP